MTFAAVHVEFLHFGGHNMDLLTREEHLRCRYVLPKSDHLLPGTRLSMLQLNHLLYPRLADRSSNQNLSLLIDFY